MENISTLATRNPALTPSHSFGCNTSLESESKVNNLPLDVAEGEVKVKELQLQS